MESHSSVAQVSIIGHLAKRELSETGRLDVAAQLADHMWMCVAAVALRDVAIAQPHAAMDSCENELISCNCALLVMLMMSLGKPRTCMQVGYTVTSWPHACPALLAGKPCLAVLCAHRSLCLGSCRPAA